MINYINYFNQGGSDEQFFPIPDTIQGKNYILKSQPGKIINSDFFSKNNLRYVGKRLVEAFDAFDSKMATINDLVNSYGKSLDIAMGIKPNPKSQYLDRNWDVNRLTYNQPRP